MDLQRVILSAEMYMYVIDGFPVPICHYVRSSKCKSFKGLVSYGYCDAKDKKYYGFTETIKGILIGNKSYISDEKRKNFVSME